jgi:hypothetical protein
VADRAQEQAVNAAVSAAADDEQAAVLGYPDELDAGVARSSSRPSSTTGHLCMPRLTESTAKYPAKADRCLLKE